MRFFGFGERSIRPEIVGSPTDFPEISQQEIGRLDERQYPYQSLVRVYRKDKIAAFQALEPADQSEAGLQDYRSKEIGQILTLLESNQIVSLVAPSRAAKTEAVLAGDYHTIDKEDTLFGKTDGFFFDIGGQFGGSLTDEQLQYTLDHRIEQAQEGRDQELNKVALCDEFIPDSDLHQKLLQALIQKDFKCVVTQGGFLSNATKKSSIDELSSRVGLTIPTVEMSIKPFNAKQLAEMAQRKNIEDAPGIKQLEELSARIPLPYHIAKSAISDVKQGPISEEQLWKKLHDSFSGVYSINELKRAIKKKQQTF